MASLNDRFRGLILGTAVGDSVGLPAEGLSRKRNARFFKGNWKQRFIFGKGMVSDDTEHTIFVAQALLKHADSSEAFARRLGWSLRLWLLSLPAGVGMATARAILKLWLGIPPTKSGVFSAGNGPAMRIAPIGAFFCDDTDTRNQFTELSTTITHTDPKALYGAKAISETVAWIVRDDLTEQPELKEFSALLRSITNDPEWTQLVDTLENSLNSGMTISEFADSMGLNKGVTGYVYHTVPICLFAWHRHFGNYERTLTSVLDCGGDADTTGAIVGALAGATVGESGIPSDWLTGIREWPRTTIFMRRIADALAVRKDGGQATSVPYFWVALPFRNLVFLLIVLAHGFRRLLPPY